MKTFKLTIATPTGHKYENDEVTMVTADLLTGRMGVLAEHSPLVSSLKVSKFKITDKDGKMHVGVVKGGIFNVAKTEVSILTTNFCMEDEVKMEHVISELKNVEYQMQADVKEAEAQSLDNRYKYALLKQELEN